MIVLYITGYFFTKKIRLKPDPTPVKSYGPILTF